MTWQGPPKWGLTLYGVAGGTLWLLVAAMGKPENGFQQTLDAALMFFGGLTGVGTVGAAYIHRTTRRYQQPYEPEFPQPPGGEP